MPLFSLRPAATLWPPVLLGSQFVFNIGFYAVVPFLALFLRDDMLLSGGLIGLILGPVSYTHLTLPTKLEV